jgi:RNA polymerase sigma-70 factor, ECF subfamily
VRTRVDAHVANTDDQQLLARLRAGDAEAFDTLVRRFHAPLKRLARAFVSTDASADEVVQDTWLAVLASLDTFEERSSLRTWISRILINRSKTRGVREARMTPFSALADNDDPAEPALEGERFDEAGHWRSPPARWDAETPEQLVSNQQAMTILASELAQLPERQRVIVILRDTLGWTSEEVCNALEINETNQRVLLHRARTRLRATLEAHVAKR